MIVMVKFINNLCSFKLCENKLHLYLSQLMLYLAGYDVSV